MSTNSTRLFDSAGRNHTPLHYPATQSLLPTPLKPHKSIGITNTHTLITYSLRSTKYVVTMDG